MTIICEHCGEEQDLVLSPGGDCRCIQCFEKCEVPDEDNFVIPDSLDPQLASHYYSRGDDY